VISILITAPYAIETYIRIQTYIFRLINNTYANTLLPSKYVPTF
jgi:hypothetical protein